MVVDSNSSNMNTMIWNNALKLLENDMNKPTFDTWNYVIHRNKKNTLK